ncbi:MAG: hypothetical protein QNJ94_18080 [Alphaproteobacteria bacterium]|nr:hypothetical protein [Alphaproteobacteria bacterium]
MTIGAESRRTSRTSWRPCLVSLLAIAVAACETSTLQWQTGRIPDVDALEQRLVLGQSTAAEVRAVLGEPAGEGAVMMPKIDRKSRPMWSYYYSRGTVTVTPDAATGDSRRIGLFVYFDEGRYDGYQWFSTLPEHAREDLIR